MYRFQMCGRRCSHYLFDDPGDVLEPDLLLQKRGYGDLVGGVEGDGFGASGAGRFVGAVS